MFKDIGLNQIFAEETEEALRENLLLSRIAEKVGLTTGELLKSLEGNPDILK
ncbi:hypothetical protein KJ903_05025 [Patescibacteria group bacterium]|nr:hypothetical protein [Patescibacteria group bacterium]